MISAAKLIVSHGKKLVNFARILAKYCKDKRYVINRATAWEEICIIFTS